ncbi:hypothetical protein LIER_31864 [Lithospermum erythrorhizon]|uniref:Uncharacterized protein n=1 Tax=Lithospermum erythrorhizon TaxID=34254 RepID=A0AAV3RXJ3_LITER
MHLDFFRHKNNQKKMRYENYKGLIDSIVAGIQKGGKVELPDKNEDPYLYSLVVKHMMHGPCGDLNPGNVRMVDGRCKNHYPKAFSDYTTHGKGTYPICRRRDNKRQAKIQEAKTLNLLYKEFPKFYVWDDNLRTWTRRKKGTCIGRLCTVNPIENERYYLIVLLSNVRGPSLFEYLLRVNGSECSTFQEAAHKRGLLHNDDDIEQTLQEASVFKMPPELHIMRIKNQMRLSSDDVLHKILQGINDTLESLGRDINEFKLIQVCFN